MGFDQYHEPANELPQEVRTFARMIVSLIEEAQAIDWYEQRLAVERDQEAKEIMANAQQEEFKHFSMDLEFLIRRKPKWQAVLQVVLFSNGNIVERGTRGEQREEQVGSSPIGASTTALTSPDQNGSLGIGSLKGVSQHE